MSRRFTWEREVKEATMPPTRKLVLLAVATHANKIGKAWPSQARLADECGVSERTIRKHIAAAIEEGWLVRTRKGHKVGRAPEQSQTAEYLLASPNRNEGSYCNESPTGSTVPAGDLQPEPGDLQPEPTRFAVGTQRPPINKDQDSNHCPHADLQRESDPFESAPDRDAFEQKPTPRPRVPELAIFEAAKKLGKQLASLTDDLEMVEAQFQSDKLLRNFPEVLHTTVTNWRTERVRIGLAAPEQRII